MPKCPECGHEFNDHPSNMLESEKWDWEKKKSSIKLYKNILGYGPVIIGLFALDYLLFLLGYIQLSVAGQIQIPISVVFGILYLLYARKQYQEFKDKYERVGLWDLLTQ